MEDNLRFRVLEDVTRNQYDYDENTIQAKCTTFQMYFSQLVIYCRRIGEYFVNDILFFNILWNMKKKVNSLFIQLDGNRSEKTQSMLDEIFSDYDDLIIRFNQIDDKYLSASRSDTLLLLNKLKTLLCLI